MVAAPKKKKKKKERVFFMLFGVHLMHQIHFSNVKWLHRLSAADNLSLRS
jgi:hypothetical protein